MPTLRLFMGLICGLSLLGATMVAQADGRKNATASSTTAPPSMYEKACGSCHMAYPPMLLPAASWSKIVPTSGEHFGDKLDLTADQLREVQSYLTTNAADRVSAKLGRKITESLGGASPELISEVPYIVRKHRKVPPATFARTSVGGLGNCMSCHPGAVRGDFNDDAVKIPN